MLCNFSYSPGIIIHVWLSDTRLSTDWSDIEVNSSFSHSSILDSCLLSMKVVKSSFHHYLVYGWVSKTNCGLAVFGYSFMLFRWLVSLAIIIITSLTFFFEPHFLFAVVVFTWLLTFCSCLVGPLYNSVLNHINCLTWLLKRLCNKLINLCFYERFFLCQNILRIYHWFLAVI